MNATKPIPAELAGMPEEHARAIMEFEAANESHDLRAFGHTRREATWRCLAAAYLRIESLGIAGALTPHEIASGCSAMRRFQ